MADTKISALTALTGANLATDDVFPVVETSEGAADTGNKKMTAAELAKGLGPLPRTAVTTPLAAPSSGEMVQFPFTRAGLTRPAYRNADGLFQSLQGALYNFNNHWWLPYLNGAGFATNTGASGAAFTGAGTLTAAAFNASAFATSLPRAEYLVTVASTSAVAGFRLASGNWNYTRGSSAKIGGFYQVIRWGPATGVSTSTTRAIVGACGHGALADTEPSTLLNIVGMGWDAADTQVQIMHNDGAGTATKIPLGASWPKPTADRTSVYEIHIYAPPNSSNVYYTVLDLVNDLEASGTITTNIPATTQFMNPHGQISVGGTNSVIGIAVYGAYVGTYY